MTLSNNSFSGNSNSNITNAGAHTVDASGNWWGSNTLAGVTGSISGSVDYTPWLNVGTDVGGNPADGFQGDFSTLDVSAAGLQVGSIGRIQEAINLLADGSLTGSAHTINVAAGTYQESNISVSKSMTIQGASRSSVIVAPAIANVHDDSTFGGTPNNAFVIRHSGVTIKDLTIDGGAGQGFRSGIVTDYWTATYNNTVVDTVAVNNIYRRGVYIVADDVHSTGNEVLNSTFDNIGTSSSLPYEHAFAIMVGDADTTISGNVITNSSIGIASNYFISEATAPRLTVTGNSISLPVSGAAQGAIGMDLSGMADGSIIGGAPGDMIPGTTTPVRNTIDMTGGSGHDIGIVVQYAVTGATVTVRGNTVTAGAGDTGLYLYQNADSAHPVLVQNNTISGVGTGTGILATDDGSVFTETPHSGTTYATLTGNTISGYATDIAVQSAGTNSVAVTIGGSGSGAGNTVTATATGIQVQGAEHLPRSAATRSPTTVSRCRAQAAAGSTPRRFSPATRSTGRSR